MIIILTILLFFICLIVVAIWYDRIIPPFSKWMVNFSASENYKNWKKPVLYGISIFICFGFLFQDWGMFMMSPGAQSNERWGFPTSRSAVTLFCLIVIAYFIYFTVRKFKAFYSNSPTKTEEDKASPVQKEKSSRHDLKEKSKQSS